MPLLNHLPDAAPGILLYSGDEDHAEVAWNDEEFDAVAAAGGRMNLYIIPNLTHSTAEDGRRYRARHDIGPHPNLRPLDGRPVSERLAEFDRQIRMFQDTFGTPARSVRNHCTAWAGYLEPIEVLERLGVRMDGNYFSGNYMRDREGAPYAAFGGAMPMRFCHPDGRLIDVFHQHTHLLDDGSFSPDAEYSFKLSPGVFPGVLDRAFTDIARRFHTPYGVCIHPSNWVKFSRPQGQELLRQAVEKGFPIWSFDQWCTFWDARDTWRLSRPTWDGSTMDVTVEGRDPHDSLGLILPIAADGARLTRVSLDGEAAAWQQASRYREEIALVSVPTGKTTVAVRTTYGEP